jgi:cell division protein FtsQ
VAVGIRAARSKQAAVDRTFALPLPRTFRLPRRIPLPRRPRVALAAVLLALALLGGGWLWLRNSPLVAVEHVSVLGAHGPQAHAVEAALQEAAMHMSTLNVNVAALQAAVAPLRVVRAVRVSTSFPHTLRVRVIEQLPVAAVVIGGVRTAVAADGTVLGPALLSSSLPTLSISAGDRPDATRVQGADALAALSVLGAAPATLAGWVAHVYEGREGLTVAMRNGLLIYFGDASRPHAKWLSAARVLASSSSAGAWYVDVRLPERPAAGISGGSTAAGTATSSRTTGEVSASDPTAASLAESLAAAINGSAGTASTAAPTTSTTAGAGSTSPSATAAPAETVAPVNSSTAPATPSASPMSTSTSTAAETGAAAATPSAAAAGSAVSGPAGGAASGAAVPGG